jgi:hypothetical protein
MLSNFIYSKKKYLFEEKLAAGEILDEAIVFIEDTKEIWNHGTYFSTKISDETIKSITQEIVNESIVSVLNTSV